MHSSIRLNRLRVVAKGHAVYDQQFEKGVNIIHGENSSGKSTILDFIFYVFGGEFDDWKQAAKQCEEVQAEVHTQQGTITLKRAIKGKQEAIDVFFGNMLAASKSALDGWTSFNIRRVASGKESFSQIIFRASGIPEAKSMESSNVTMHQIMRLLYSDQRTPAPRLFRFDSTFDTKELRIAAGELLCGISVYELYEIELQIRELTNRYKTIEDKYDLTFRLLPKDETIANINALKTRLRELNEENDKLANEIKNIDSVDMAEAADNFIAERNKLRAQLSSLKSEVSKIEFDLETLEYEELDIGKYLNFIEETLDNLKKAEVVSDVIGAIDFTMCPACLNPIDKDKKSGHCSLCGEETDPETEKSRYLAIKLDTQIQQRETKQLLQVKKQAIKNLKAEKRKLASNYKKLLREYTSIYDVSNSPREAYLSERHHRIGQLEREHDYLLRLQETILLLEELSQEKADIQRELDFLKERERTLRYQNSSRKTQALSLIGKLTKEILFKDIERQEEFVNAENVVLNFEADSIEVDGVLNFAASSNVILKNSAILAFFEAACVDPIFNHPRFLLMDNIEDKGMELVRAHQFQKTIIDVSNSLNTDHQIIFSTSDLHEDYDTNEFVVGTKYTHENKTLDFSAVESHTATS